MLHGTQIRVAIDVLGLTWHHGIYVGDGRVIHMSSEQRGNFFRRKLYSRVHETTLTNFAGGGKVEEVFSITIMKEHGILYSDFEDIEYKHAPDFQAVSRAKAKLGASGYDLFNNNCEHFAIYCKTGKHRSSQLDFVLWYHERVGRRILSD